MPKNLCKICWELVEDTGPCPKQNVKCELDFGQTSAPEAPSGAAADDGNEGPGVSADLLPAGAWTGCGATWQLVAAQGSGFKKVYAQCDLLLNEAKDVPGTDFQLVCPMQQHVNPNIVNAKVEAFKAKAPDKHPIVPVVYNKNTGKVTINGDGHHTFVACLKARITVRLWLYKVPFAGTHKDWRTCTYKAFSLNPAGATGTKFG